MVQVERIMYMYEYGLGHCVFATLSFVGFPFVGLSFVFEF